MREFTKNRAALLRLFFTNPDRPFYMQEVGRILGKKPGVFQRAINNMEKEGVLTSEYKAHARYFKTNKAYPLYKELKSIVFKTVGVAGSLKELLEKIGGIRLAFIYGSYAKAKENYLSDIDLVIVGNPDEDALIKKLDRLEDVLSREINYKVYSPRELKMGLKAQDPFLLEILNDRKIMILGEEDDIRKIPKR
jgi:predicted nucleotidyltransferase